MPKKYIFTIIIIVFISTVLLLAFTQKKFPNKIAQNSEKPTSEKTNLVASDNGQSQVLNIQYDQISGVDKNLLSLDIYNVEKNKQKPAIIMVHGGAWTTGDKANENIISPKKEFFDNLGYVFVSVNYRLSPQYSFPDYPNDVANSIKWILQNGSNYGIDTTKIFVMGHSAGAHLAALTIYDQSYALQNLGIKGLILLDGAGYDIPLSLKNSDKEIRTEIFEQAFTSDIQTQKKASPIYQIQTNTNLPKTLILYVQRRQDSKEQSNNLYQKLLQSGNQASIFAIPNTTHEQINANLGKKDYLATQKVEEFLIDM